MKKYLPILTILLIGLLAAQLAQSTSTCADNPLLPFLEKFVGEQNDFIQKEARGKDHKRILQENTLSESESEETYTPLSDEELEDYEEETSSEQEENRRFLIDWDKVEEKKEQAKQKAKEKRQQKKDQSKKPTRDGETKTKPDNESRETKKGGTEEKKRPTGKKEEQKGKDSDKKQTKKEKAIQKAKEKREKKKQAAKEKRQKIKEAAEKKVRNKILEQLFDGEGIEEIRRATPTIKRGFGICSSLDGELSCCSKEAVKKFKKLTRGYFLKKLKRRPRSSRFFKKLDQIFTKNAQKDENTCPLKTIKKIYFTIKNLDPIKKAIKKERVCQKTAIITTTNMIRGTICQACIDPAKHEDFFDGEGSDLKLRIVPETIDNYKESMNDQFKCIKASMGIVKAAVKAVLDEVKKKSDEVGYTACNGLLDDLYALLSRKEKNDDGECNRNPDFFSDGCLIDLEDGEEKPDGEDRPRPPARRLLQSSSSGSYIEDPNGASGVYEEDGEEAAEMGAVPDIVEVEQEQEQEEAQEGLDEENEVYDDGNEGGDGSSQSGINPLGSSASLIGFAIIQLILVVLLV